MQFVCITRKYIYNHLGVAGRVGAAGQEEGRDVAAVVDQGQVERLPAAAATSGRGSPTQSERMWTGTWWGAGAMKREKSTVGERVRGEKGGE